jgi:hypothetical protein
MRAHARYQKARHRRCRDGSGTHASGKLANLSSLTSSWIGELGPAASGWQVNGQQYGIPYDQHVVGFSRSASGWRCC